MQSADADAGVRSAGPLPEGGNGMQFRVLGPLEIETGDGLLSVRGPKQRALLAMLLMHPNEVVSRDHVVMVVGVQDPQVEEWAHSVPENATDAYRKAAAIASLEERHRTVARLRGLGATVIDAPPGFVAPQLADAYLHLKATGRL